MFVCLCKSISEKDIRKAMEAGAEDVIDVMDATGAGTECGTCIPYIEATIESIRKERLSPPEGNI